MCAVLPTQKRDKVPSSFLEFSTGEERFLSGTHGVCHCDEDWALPSILAKGDEDSLEGTGVLEGKTGGGGHGYRLPVIKSPISSEDLSHREFFYKCSWSCDVCCLRWVNAHGGPRSVFFSP